MSSAVLCVYVDSASDLPLMHSGDKPNAFAKLGVSHSERLTSVKKGSDSPVWEQGFTFLIENPEQDCLKIQIVGQTSSKKDGESLGEFTYSLNSLLRQTDLRNVLQAFQLQKSGTNSTVKLSMALKILKQSGTQSLPIISPSCLSRTSSLQSQPSLESSSSEKGTGDERVSLRSIRQLSADSSMGLGSIKLTLNYSSICHILTVTVHKVM